AVASGTAPASSDAAMVEAAVEDAAARATREAEALRHAIGLADTQQHTPGPQVQAVLGRKHARTLRMEIGISSLPPRATTPLPSRSRQRRVPQPPRPALPRTNRSSRELRNASAWRAIQMPIHVHPRARPIPSAERRQQGARAGRVRPRP